MSNRERMSGVSKVGNVERSLLIISRAFVISRVSLIDVSLRNSLPDVGSGLGCNAAEIEQRMYLVSTFINAKLRSSNNC